jgi:putative phosphoesterase
MRIGLLSDTHSYLDEGVFRHFENCDEIWHAGDVGDISVIEKLQKFKKLRAVYGNIDGQEIRKQYPEYDVFTINKLKFIMIHIAGKFGYYTPQLRLLIKQHAPNILICGHSHILKVQYDKYNQLLYINPGAAGKSGFHQVKTLMRFTVETDKLSTMEVIELGARAEKI